MRFVVMNNTCTKMALSELITQHTDVEKISDVKNERYITLSSYGKGAHERVIRDGKYPVPFSGYRVSAGQFIYSRIDARNGAYDIVPSELEGCVVSKDFPVFDVDSSKVLPRYLLRSVLSNSFIEQVKKSSFGATNRMRIKEDVFGAYLISVPSLEEQAEIVECIDKVQSIIDLRRRELDRIDNLIKARFVELFGDPETNPFNWEECSLIEKLEVLGGYAFKSEDFEETGIPVLRIGNVNSGFFKPVNMVFWKEDSDLERYAIYPGDLVMSLTGTVGKNDYGNVCILGNDYDKYYLNQRNAKLEIKKDLEKQYLSHLLKFENIKKRLTGISRGVRQANIANKDILNLVVPIPPIEIQKQFSVFVKQIDKSKSVVQKALDETQMLFDSMMQQYFG